MNVIYYSDQVHMKLSVVSATCVIYFVSAPLIEWDFFQIF